MKFSIKKINLFISSFLLIVLLFDLFTEGGIFKNNFFYSGNVIFVDLRVIIPNLEELSNWNLFDTAKTSSTELFDRRMNYPIIWVYIFNFLSWFGNPIIVMGIFQLLTYILFAKIILYKTNKNFYLYFFLLFSPPLLLMMERGNTDCFIFFLLLFSILTKNYLSGFLLGFATSLKVYPIFILPFYFFFKKINKKFFIGFIITLPLIIWTFFQYNILISHTLISFSTSFGIYSFALLIIKALKEVFQIEIGNNYIIYFYLISLSLFLFLSLVFNFLFKKDLNKIIGILNYNKLKLMIFILSSTITILIFFAFSNWAYRIVFLLPATLIYVSNLQKINNLFNNKKKYFYLLLVISPFFFPWIISTTDKNLVLLNYHSWAFYCLVVFFSLIFYFVICFNFYLIKFKSLKFTKGNFNIKDLIK